VLINLNHEKSDMKLTKTIALTAATLMAATTAFASELPGSADK